MSYVRFCFAFAVSLGILAGCGSDGTDAGGPVSASSSAQLPPTTGGADVEAWLAKGEYKKWSCETVSHPQMKVSPHGQNRICSNDLVAGFSGTGERPKGSAAVKELYDDSQAIVGYAVEVKVADTSDGGKNWYWYERLPGMGVVADGFGNSGTPKSICVGCHAAAGSDDAHTVTASSDYVYGVVN
jgi:hypothetical protein